MIHLDGRDPALEKTLAWLIRELGTLQYGEVTVAFVLHEGKIKGIDRTVKEKENKNSCRKVN